MARKRNKNKRARTVSERQDYRQGGMVKDGQMVDRGIEQLCHTIPIQKPILN